MRRQLPTLPEYSKDFISYTPTATARHVVYQLHRWLDNHDLQLQNVTPAHLDQFLVKPIKKQVAPSTRRVYAAMLRRYFTYLYNTGHVKFYYQKAVSQHASKKYGLPSYAVAYLANSDYVSATPYVASLHRWLQSRNLTTLQLQIGQLKEFLKKPNNRKIKLTAQRNYQRHLLKYLEFLHEKKLLSFKPELTRFNPKFLPPSARNFLDEIAINLKPGTVQGYATTLRNFHDYILKHTASIYDLKREYVLAWMKCIKDKQLHPSTRSSMIGNLRVYLYWLYERDSLYEYPESLVQSHDFPKLPEYLPRPLSPKVDMLLQDFLLNRKHGSLYTKGLWLMRKAGLRIGELSSLEINCIRTDQRGNAFLKVPLGKLNNERLVPISEQAVQIISELQQRAPLLRKYLVSNTLTQKTKAQLFYTQLKRATKKLKLPTPILSHQLRHTCATELINNGMSLTSVMHFLGHKDYRMTLRYAKITQETIVGEFHRTTQHIGQRYQTTLQTIPNASDNGPALLANLIKWCHKQSPAKENSRILKRLYRLKREIEKIARTTNNKNLDGEK